MEMWDRVGAALGQRGWVGDSTWENSGGCRRPILKNGYIDRDQRQGRDLLTAPTSNALQVNSPKAH